MRCTRTSLPNLKENRNRRGRSHGPDQLDAHSSVAGSVTTGAMATARAGRASLPGETDTIPRGEVVPEGLVVAGEVQAAIAAALETHVAATVVGGQVIRLAGLDVSGGPASWRNCGL